MDCSKEEYLEYVVGEIERLRPIVEAKTNTSLEDLIVKDMDLQIEDLQKDLVDKGYKAWKVLLGVNLARIYKFFSSKKNSWAKCPEGVKNLLYINTSPKNIRRLVKEAIPFFCLHELYHVAQQNFAESFFLNTFNDKSIGMRETMVRAKINAELVKGYANYSAIATAHEAGLSDEKVGRIRYMFSRNYGYKFFRDVCWKFGDSYAPNVFKDPPKTLQELQNPQIYIQRKASMEEHK